MRAKAGPYLPSLSRMRNLGAFPKGVASRSCWVTQASVGWRVTPTCTTRRRAKRDHEEGVHGAEERVRDRQEVAGPDVAGVVAQERRPGLPGPPRPTRIAH